MFSESQKGVEPRANHERTTRNCRRTVENGNRWGTGGSGGEAVKESPFVFDFDFEIPDFDSLLDDLDLDFSLDDIDLDFSFDLSEDLPSNSERTEKK